MFEGSQIEVAESNHQRMSALIWPLFSNLKPPEK